MNMMNESICDDRKPNKHAYLVIAHHQFDLLKRILKLLDHPNHDFYIHIDVKATDFSADEFLGITRFGNIHFVERKNVVWGGYSQIDCELHLLNAAVSKTCYSYYHLISGVDMPLKTADEIYNFFEDCGNKEFIHYSSDDYCSCENVYKRVAYHHVLQESVGRTTGALSKVEKACLAIQKRLGVNRWKHMDKPLGCGANWFSITHDLARYVVEHKEWIYKHFKNSFCADEVFLQTLIQNTPFYDNLYKKVSDGDYHTCMRYVDWNRGNPYTFRTEDYEDLISSDYIFARKFDLNVDSEIIDKLEKYLCDKSPMR